MIVAATLNQWTPIRLRGVFIDEMKRKTNSSGKSPWIASPEPVRSAAAAMQQDPGVYKRPINTHDEVVAALRELMKLGKDDPAPQPPPLVEVKKDDKKPAKKADAEE